MSNLKIILSKANDASYNLALEEYLIENEIYSLYLWQNTDTIVIGRNQNPYQECNLEQIKKDQVKLVRRKSGGGAVFHDLGNLNFTIISKKYEGCIEDNFKLVIEVLKKFGINASTSGRNDLEVLGKKISGSAFFETDNAYLHHGTLLINVNLNKLSNYLKPSKLKLESKGITSVKSRVSNLVQFNKDITTPKIIKEFLKLSNDEPIIYTKESIEANQEIMDKVKVYNSYEWVYGESMKYNTEIIDKFNWGLITIKFMIEKGIITSVNLSTDSIIMDNFKELESQLINKKFLKDELIKVINETIKNTEIKKDLVNLTNKNFK